MERNKTLALIVAISFVLVTMTGIVTAVEYHQRGEALNIVHSVRKDGGITSTAVCNLTMINPGKTILVDFKQMTYNSGTQTHNYSLNGQNFSTVGTYNYDVTCLDSGLNKTQSFELIVNPLGYEYTIEEGITYIFMLIVLIALFLLCAYGTVKFPWKNERNSYDEIIKINWKKYAKIFSFLMAYFMVVWIVYLSWNLSYGFLHNDILGAFMKVLFTFLVGLAFPTLVIIFIFTLVIYFHDRNLAEMLQRGIPTT